MKSRLPRELTIKMRKITPMKMMSKKNKTQKINKQKIKAKSSQR